MGTKDFMIIPQNSADSLIIPNGSWYEQMVYPKRAVKSNVNIEEVKEVLKFLGLDKKVTDFTENELLKERANWNEFSGGEKQRILLARVLYQKPKYLIMDESFSNLDNEWKEKIYQRLHESGCFYLT